jgi:MoaA/NifB/PqqE/SkfB family radical SAM enzyme
MRDDLRPLDKNTVAEYIQSRSCGDSPKLCFAPFNSMVFEPHGLVKACCHSFRASDKYPEKSIKEIWSGGVFKEMRAHMNNNSLPPACSFCRTHIESGEFFGVASRTYDAYLPIKHGYPTIMEFFLDITCNLECVMCTGEFSSSIRKNREKLSPFESIYGDSFVNELREFIPYLQKASFVGGEPFLIDIHYQIWKMITKLNPQCRISVTTNGTILNDRVKSMLDAGNFNIILSLDSVSKEVYEKIRVNAKYDSVMENLKYFHNYCKNKGTTFEIVPCPQKLNWHETPKMVEFANGLDSMLYFSTAVRYPFLVCLWTLSSNELKKIHSQLSTFDPPSNTLIEQHNRRIYLDFINEVEMWIGESLKRESPPKDTPIEEENSELKNQFYNTLSKFVMNLPAHTSQGKEEKVALLISRINHLLRVRPVGIGQNDVFEFLSSIPMELFVSWTSTATVVDFTERVINELRSPYK